MGYSCSSMPVKAKVVGWVNGGPGFPRKLPEWMLMVVKHDLDSYEEYLVDKLYDSKTNPNPVVTVHKRIDIENTGWIFEWETKDFLNNKDFSYDYENIYGASVIKKGDKKVYALNTDKHNCVEGITVEFFVVSDDDKNDLVDFVSDLFPERSTQISTNATVQQWL